MPRANTPPADRNWKAAGERALTSALNKADELARDCGDTKQLTEMIKVVGEIVGTGIVLSRKPTEASESGGDDNDE